MVIDSFTGNFRVIDGACCVRMGLSKEGTNLCSNVQSFSNDNCTSHGGNVSRRQSLSRKVSYTYLEDL